MSTTDQHAPGGRVTGARLTRWITVPTALAVTAVTFALGFWQKYPCHSAGWPNRSELMFGQRCYSDVPVLLRERGLAEGIFPYAPNAGEHPLEYPVISGLVMDVTARLARLLSPAGDAALARTYFFVTLALLFLLALATVWVTARTTGDPVDGLLVAAAPSLALAGTINWDLLAVTATALALLAWSRQRPWLAGICIGLGTAAKLYPALLLGPILILALRQRRWRPALGALAAAGASWLVVNLPVWLLYPDGWAVFYQFNQERGAEFGSFWYALKLLHVQVHPLNEIAMGLLGLGCAGVAWLGLRARRTPPLAALAFLVVVAFLVTNKVYSPQYVLWLLPLAVLARLRLPDLIIWQAAEVVYWAAIWDHISGSITDGWYSVTVFVRIAVTLWLCLRVVVGVTGERGPFWRLRGWPRPAGTSGPGGGSRAPADRRDTVPALG